MPELTRGYDGIVDDMIEGMHNKDAEGENGGWLALGVGPWPGMN
jgi:hypothetical protein